MLLTVPPPTLHHPLHRTEDMMGLVSHSNSFIFFARVLYLVHFCNSQSATLPPCTVHTHSMTATKQPPWYAKNDTDERNQKAKEAFTALLQVVAREPEDEEYRQFSKEVSSPLSLSTLCFRWQVLRVVFRFQVVKVLKEWVYVGNGRAKSVSITAHQTGHYNNHQGGEAWKKS